jgi:hypothetical protein
MATRKSADALIQANREGAAKSGGFTEARLAEAGYPPAERAKLLKHYRSLETTGLRAAFTKQVFSDPSEIATRAAQTRKGKSGNGKGSAKRSEAARKAAATRKANGGKSGK